MNALLTTIAAALVLALLAALVGPHFVDWTSYRADFERSATQLVGAPVRVRGPVEARLLPHPSIRFSDVEIGASGEAAKLTARSFSMRLFPAPLLRGEVHVRDVDVISPRLVLEIAPDGETAFPFDKNVLANHDLTRVTLERIGIVNGVIELRDPETARNVEISRINGTGSAGTLAGPFKFEGDVTQGGKPFNLRLATGRFASERIQTKIDLVSRDGGRSLSADGGFSFAELLPTFTGQLVWARAASDRTEPLRLAGAVKATAREVRSDDLALQIGPDDRALRFEGFGDLALGKEPRAQLTLHSRQLDVDRLVGAAETKMSVQRAAAAFHERLSLTLGSLQGRLELKTEGIQIGQELVRDAEIGIERNAGGLQITEARATLPGSGSVALSGDILVEGAEPGFQGRAEAEIGDWPLLSSWLGLPQTAGSVREIGFSGDVEASADRIALADATLSLDGEEAMGQLLWQRSANEPTSLSVSLEADTLDLDALNIPALQGVAGNIGALEVFLKAQTLRYERLDAKDVSIDLSNKGGDLTINRLGVADIGGAQVDLQGNLSVKAERVTGALSGRIAASNLDGVTRLLAGTPLPRAFVDALSRRADALAPLKADVFFGADHNAPGRIIARANGTAGESRFATRTMLDRLALDAAIDTEAEVVSADANTLLRQFGFPVIALEAGGEAKFRLNAKGALDLGVDTKLSLALLGSDVTASGPLKLVENRVEGQLDLVFASEDVGRPMSRLGRLPPVSLDPIPFTGKTRLVLSGDRLSLDGIEGKIDGRSFTGKLAFTGAGGRSVSGDIQLERFDLSEALALGVGALSGADEGQGLWPAGPISPGPFDGFTGRVALTIERASLPWLPGLSEVQGVLSLGKRETRFDQISARMAGGSFEGSLGMSLLDDGLSLQLAASVKSASLPGIAAVAEGTVDASIDAQGVGPTIAAAVSELSGGGVLTLHGIEVARLDPTAFARLRDRAQAGLGLEPANIRQAFNEEAAKASLTVGSATGAFTIAGGMLRLSNMAVEAIGATLAPFVSVDLKTMQLDGVIGYGPKVMEGVEASQLPRVSFPLKGEVFAPESELDVMMLTGFLTAEAIDREVTRIQDLEDAAHERARLRREEDARDKQRQAEEEKRRAAARKAEQERVANQVPALPPPLVVEPAPGSRGGAAPFDLAPSDAPGRGQGPLIILPSAGQQPQPVR